MMKNLAVGDLQQRILTIDCIPIKNGLKYDDDAAQDDSAAEKNRSSALFPMTRF